MINFKVCPFCKQSNKCQANSLLCWCKDVKISLELIELVPKKYKMKACICKNCVELFKKDKKSFLSKYS